MGSSSGKRIVVATHGHCFDGIASAAVFTTLRRRLGGGSGGRNALAFHYRSCGYGPNLQTVPERWLRGDENAILDFRFTDSRRLTWYFDHHPTAFANPHQRERALAGADRYFFDDGYGSCTKLIADVAAEKYGIALDHHEELIAWADRIDAARFESAADAIDRTLPVAQLAAVVEHGGNGDLYNALIPELVDKPLADVTALESVRAAWRPLAEAQADTRRRIEAALERRGNVAFADLHRAPLRSSGKFVAYALAPDCAYSVALIRMARHLKISIGFNPWSGQTRHHDIAALCRRHGGGGHPVVGAIPVPLDRIERAQHLCRDVIAHLNEPGAGPSSGG